MAGLVSNLIDILQGQTKLFGEVVALSVQKRQFIVKNDIDALRAVVKQENVLVPKALKNDKDRERIMTDIATVLNKKQDELTLSYLGELIQGQPEHDSFVRAVDEFLVAMQEMKEANDAAKVLVQDALEYIDFNMNIIHSSLDSGPVGYGALEDSHEPGSFLDTRS